MNNGCRLEQGRNAFLTRHSADCDRDLRVRKAETPPDFLTRCRDCQSMFETRVIDSAAAGGDHNSILSGEPAPIKESAVVVDFEDGRGGRPGSYTMKYLIGRSHRLCSQGSL